MSKLFSVAAFDHTLKMMHEQFERLRVEDDKTRLDKLTMMAVSSHVPIIALYRYALQESLFPNDELLRSNLESAIKFYKYTGVLEDTDLVP